MSIQICITSEQHAGNDWYRALQPVIKCRKPLLDYGITLSLEREFWGDNYDAYYDCYILTGIIEPKSLCKIRHKKLVTQIDDNFWDCPFEPFTSRLDEVTLILLNKQIEISEQVWVTTETLKKVVEAKTNHKNVKVLPNLIDCNLYHDYEQKFDPVRIIWAGGQTHFEDLQMIEWAIKEIAEEYKDKVFILFFGYHGDIKLTKNIGYIKPVNVYDYPKTLCALGCSIGIAPLASWNYNDSKSNIKYLEYSLAGCAFIGTGLKPYEKCKGVLVNPVTQNFYESLAYLIEVPELCKKYSEQAKEDVYENWSWQTQRSVWLTAFKSLRN